jgi:hypothetical protein
MSQHIWATNEPRIELTDSLAGWIVINLARRLPGVAHWPDDAEEGLSAIELSALDTDAPREPSAFAEYCARRGEVGDEEQLRQVRAFIEAAARTGGGVTIA